MQENLFSQSEDLVLPGGAKLTIFREWLSDEDAGVFFSGLLKSVKWEQPTIRIAGQSRLIPRKQAWYGHIGAGFTYSGTHFEPVPFTEEIVHLKRLVEIECQHEFNSVLINLYRDENDSVSWHADDEEEFGPNPIIASLSLGAARRFQFKPKPHFTEEVDWRTRQKPVAIDLCNGDLILMKENVQVDWHHCVPKERFTCEPRINLTFRKVMPA